MVHVLRIYGCCWHHVVDESVTVVTPLPYRCNSTTYRLLVRIQDCLGHLKLRTLTKADVYSSQYVLLPLLELLGSEAAKG